MAHELKHGYDRSLGQLRTSVIKGKTIDFIEGEWDAINVQNQILYSQGKSLRADYDGIPIPANEFIAPTAEDNPAFKPTPIEAGTSTIQKPNGNIHTTTTDSKGNSAIILKSGSTK
ncbi:MAG: hypothetical protein EOP48_16930 [Sphingobacteriales bacterium]|nr:MAG: hypothetical protein EOP48_16930 [Sphingobacteriales bacterium]